jgi:predicted DNA-binding protein YlxM (UPF0122 family)
MEYGAAFPAANRFGAIRAQRWALDAGNRFRGRCRMPDRMDKTQGAALLLDFYGGLLTKRQADILDIYINDDYSLSEIAENYRISRQAVHDAIKNGMAALKSYEDRLGFAGAHRKRQEAAKQLRSGADELISMLERSVGEPGGEAPAERAGQAADGAGQTAERAEQATEQVTQMADRAGQVADGHAEAGQARQATDGRAAPRGAVGEAPAMLDIARSMRDCIRRME